MKLVGRMLLALLALTPAHAKKGKVPVAEARARWGGSLARGRRRTIVRRSRLPPRLARRPGSSARPNPGLKKDDN